ncbi:hypothetical protein FQN60_015968 [Etheostoma spectabile]|uniref:Uncharacterized protein n=1 Tax=Etheostoma spectabile TaxID=54343 RepID=A0A5J5CNB3_9PERO|nr:hypothetical protein FQN60_015968 [Etheostoma spectabile]
MGYHCRTFMAVLTTIFLGLLTWGRGVGTLANQAYGGIHIAFAFFFNSLQEVSSYWCWNTADKKVCSEELTMKHKVQGPGTGSTRRWTSK